eukprot:310258-Rhodomonas_salina.2
MAVLRLTSLSSSSSSSASASTISVAIAAGDSAGAGSARNSVTDGTKARTELALSSKEMERERAAALATSVLLRGLAASSVCAGEKGPSRGSEGPRTLNPFCTKLSHGSVSAAPSSALGGCAPL